MEDYITTMGKDGELELPKKVLKILGWKKGDEVELEVVGDKIVVRKAEHSPSLWSKLKKRRV